MKFTVAGRRFDIEPADVEHRCSRLLPDPVQEHYVVVAGRRFPPKQVLACVTGLDRADFTTHQARRVVTRLGFVAARAQRASEAAPPAGEGPHGGAQAAALRPFLGKWVALDSPAEVLVAADTPQEVVGWLARHNRRARYGMFRVPASVAEAEGAAPS
jgi:hypothetical protein